MRFQKTMFHSLAAATATAVNMVSTPSTAPSTVAKGSVLTVEDVLIAKLMYHVDRKTQREIAAHFGVTQTTISLLICKKSHKNVPLNHMTKIPEKFHELTNNKYRNYKIKGNN